MENVAEKVYMDLMARGKDIETAKRWRYLTMKFEGCCGSKGKYDRDDVIRYLCYLREQGYRQSSHRCDGEASKVIGSDTGMEFSALGDAKGERW